MSASTTELGLRAGDWVVVRSREEILATLDAGARLQGLLFQPEMLAYCGRRMQVAKVAHKTCDTITKTGGRRMHATVHLRDARCNGAAHGGCEADCVFFWKEAWLRRPDAPAAAAATPAACSEADVLRAACLGSAAAGEDTVWVCQTTTLLDASEPLPWWDVRQYVRDVTSGNHSVGHMIKIIGRAAYRKLLGLGFGYGLLVRLYDTAAQRLGGEPLPIVEGTIAEGAPTPHEVLDLKPGEWVEVKSTAQIAATITRNGFNRGMRYDPEMAKYSGRRFRVQMRVERLISEQTGRMLHMKSPCIQLEDVYCRAECTSARLGCPRASNTYWREIWLKRTAAPETDSAQSGSG
jgi:hypothetical protein